MTFALIRVYQKIFLVFYCLFSQLFSNQKAFLLLLFHII